MQILITLQQLREIWPRSSIGWAEALGPAMAEFEINTPARIAMFLAQCGHESAEGTRLVESFAYGKERLRAVFPKYFPDDKTAGKYVNRPIAIASRVYANRMGNGDEESKDGWTYRGRGLIQITGRGMYQKCGKALNMPLVNTPDVLELVGPAARSAAWLFAVEKGCNGPSDDADDDALVFVTKRINGGTNGLEERRKYYERACDVLGVAL